MTNNQVLFTGTFNPFHVAHTWQLVRAHDVVDFTNVIIAPIRNNPKKPDAVAYQHRVDLIKITCDSLDLPFTYEVVPIENVTPAHLRQFVDEFMSMPPLPQRIIGSDSMIEFANDPDLRPALEMFQYVVTVRPETDKAELEAAIADIQKNYVKDFSPVVVTIPTSEAHLQDVSSRNLRDNIQEAKDFIVPAAQVYMKNHGLYSYAPSNGKMFTA